MSEDLNKNESGFYKRNANNNYLLAAYLALFVCLAILSTLFYLFLNSKNNPRSEYMLSRKQKNVVAQKKGDEQNEISEENSPTAVPVSEAFEQSLSALPKIPEIFNDGSTAKSLASKEVGTLSKLESEYEKRALEAITPIDPASLNLLPREQNREQFALALSLRADGEHAAALTKLEKILDDAPNHPRILYEIAVCYENLAFTSKVDEIWRRIVALGDNAGAIGQLAAARLSLARKSRRYVRRRSELAIVEIANFDIRASNNTTADFIMRLNLRILPGHAFFPDKIHIKIYCYDMLDDNRIVVSNARNLPLSVVQRRVGGESPEEIYDIAFVRPKSIAESNTSLGQVFGSDERRKFFGFFLSIDYDGRAQEEIIYPSDLQNYLEKKERNSIISDSLFK